MKIVLPSYTQNYDLSPIKEESVANKYGMTFKNDKDADYSIYWGVASTGLHAHNKFGVMETGYFWNGGFIDTIGSYHCCSLNTKMAYDKIANFDLNGRRSAKEIVFSQPSNRQSKFNAVHGSNQPFSQNIVLACQNHKDRSIGLPHSSKVYWDFIDKCCKYYGKNLFIKLHPWNTNENADPYFEFAKKYNCEIAKFNMDLIKGKEFVITFNSTIAIDCILRDVPIVQYAIGTFWNCFGINFSNYSFPNSVESIDNAEKLADFLIHKYCYYKNTSADNFASMVKHYASSKEIFPMNDEFSYANRCLSS